MRQTSFNETAKLSAPNVQYLEMEFGGVYPQRNYSFEEHEVLWLDAFCFSSENRQAWKDPRETSLE